MARRDQAEVEDVETEEVVETTESTPAASKSKEPARGQLPEGYVTPVGLAKVLTDRGLHTNREGEVVKVAPQMVYSYIKNAPKDDPFPLTTVTDSIGKERQAVLVEDAVAWWERKNARTAARKQNAAAKAAAKAQREAAKAAEAPAEAEAEAEAE
jgi:ribosomal protein L12E/L44/L45/RPP1/RPP2